MMHGPGRQRNDYGANGENAVPVPGYGNGVDRKSSISHGQPQFDVARSPPTTSNKSESIIFKTGRRMLRLWQTPDMFLASSSARALVRLEVHVHSLTRWTQ
jgi:hypothetical protein